MITVPVWYDEVEIETWPRDVEKILYRRDFLIRQNGEIIGRATSSWLAIDFKTKHPGKVNVEDEWMFSSLRDKKAIDSAPDRLSPIDGQIVHNIEPRYNDFDMNAHVTSSRYLEWAIDSFSHDFYKQNFIQKFTS